MRRNSCYALVYCTLAVLAGLATAGPAMARPVRDQADLIKDKAVLEKINVTIKEIEHRFGKEVLIETFSSVPAGDAAKVKAMPPDTRKQYFLDRARGLAKSSRVNGFYIYANKSPQWLQVLEDNKTDRALPIEGKVRDAILEHFKKDDFGGGFLAGVTLIRDELVANPAAAARNSPAAPALPGRGGAAGKPEVNWAGIICIGLTVILVIWLVIGLIRAMSGRGAAGAGAGAGGGGGGGGGFMTGLLGGLVGAVAGNWLYHNMFGGGGSQAYGDGGGANAGDNDYTGSGGEWGDGGGGGDAGGGGGDWGGGGGGDWGGGGGGGDW